MIPRGRGRARPSEHGPLDQETKDKEMKRPSGQMEQETRDPDTQRPINQETKRPGDQETKI